MIEDIMYTFDRNFGRLNNLIKIYKSVSSGKGRKPTNSLDILRATTVLAHSTLEDYLRSLLIWRLPFEGKEKINQIPLSGTSDVGRPVKFSLGELVEYRGKSIDDVINKSIYEYLGTQSFNNTSDVASALSSISLEITGAIKDLFPSLAEMIKRRHNIVHRADRDDIVGSGHHRIKSISISQIEKWKKAIDKLVTEVNKNFIS